MTSDVEVDETMGVRRCLHMSERKMNVVRCVSEGEFSVCAVCDVGRMLMSAH